jgi:hypothetical protein
MEQKKVIYMNPEEVTKIDPSLVESVTMTTGSIIKVLDKNDSLNSNQKYVKNVIFLNYQKIQPKTFLEEEKKRRRKKKKK